MATRYNRVCGYHKVLQAILLSSTDKVESACQLDHFIALHTTLKSWYYQHKHTLTVIINACGYIAMTEHDPGNEQHVAETFTRHTVHSNSFSRAFFAFEAGAD